MPSQHIVVVGGGAGGLELVTKLGRKYKKDKNVRVSLVDKNLTHVWKPLLHEVAAGALDADIDGVDYRVQAANVGFHFQPGQLTGVNRNKKTITLAPILNDQGDELVAERQIEYTKLVISIGSVTNDFGTEGVAEHCYCLDSVKQATQFHHTLMNTFLALQAQKYVKPLQVAIVGAGATGVELAAELHKSAELIRTYGFDDFEMNQLRITLIEAGPRILPGLPERIADAAKQELEKLGVEVLVDKPVVKVTADAIYTGDDECFEAPLKIWAAGVKAPELLTKIEGLLTNKRNQIVVEESLLAKGDNDIFVLGDSAGFERPDGSWVPPRAQAAHQMAKVVYRNLLRQQENKTLDPFIFNDRGSLVSLSSYTAVGSLMGNLTKGAMMVEGWLARIMYKSLYRMHQVEVHGYFKTLLFIAVQGINRRLRPRLKLH